MKLYKDFCDFEPWCEATNTWELLDDNDKLDEFETKLDCLYPEGMSETELNDLLRFDSEYCLGLVGLQEENEEGDENEGEDFEEFCDKYPRCVGCPLQDKICSDCESEYYNNYINRNL